MRKTICSLIILLLCSMTTQALASEITIWDNQASGSGWYNRTTEDQEVEPTASTASGWDLEAMYYDNGILSITGEWNFLGVKNGIRSGDIFISTSGSAIYGDSIVSPPASQIFTNNFGYNYVFDVNWGSYADNLGGSYTLWQIDETSRLRRTQDFYKGNPASYVAGGANDVLVYTGTFSFSETEDNGFQGDTHYTVSGFDLTRIPGFDGTFLAHFTQECGNDVIVGQVPEPATMLLLGVGLLGIGAIGRKLPLKAS